MRIGIIGAGGRMGGLLAGLVQAADDLALAAASEAPGHPAIGHALGGGVVIEDDSAAVFAAADAVIEFTLPGPTVAHAAMAARAGVRHVIGTTGLDTAQEAALAQAAQSLPIVYAPNMSVTVNALFATVERVASLLDEDYDIEIVEIHHKHKVDAPSGTAVGLGRAAAAGRGVDLAAAAQWSREGHTGARHTGSIGFAALRGGDAVGEHTVMFVGEGERLEFTHRCTDRTLFARGALRAVRWLADKPPGLYSMRDILDL
ncbi:MAG: 4-hydroxy-tetrahydrodipicolinate reductase [Alphaproteobacteria bacterium]|nr:4-hydroxy-tetrahydrodipicolinate reductase [Alphaproteobacteria bacterium]